MGCSVKKSDFEFLSLPQCETGIAAFFAQVSPRLVGLALAHVLNLSGSMQWAVRQTAEAENNITSVERMLGYTRLRAEVPPRVAEGGGTPPAGWPGGGRLVFDGVSARYRPGLAPVLNDLTFTVEVRLWGNHSALVLLWWLLPDKLQER